MGWRNLKIFFVIILTTLVLLATAQTSTNFRHLGKKEGLSHSSVFAITQDKDGFIWLGTRDGLNKYDGFQFKVYRKNIEQEGHIISNDIRILYYDEYLDNLWAGSFDGLSQYNISDDSFTNYTTEASKGALSSNVIRGILRDAQNRLWVATKDGLNLLGPNGQFISVLPDTLSPFLRAINTIHQDEQGNLLVGTEMGLYQLQMENDTSFSLKNLFDESLNPPYSTFAVKSIVEDQSGNLWISTIENGLYYWDKELGKTISYRHDIEDVFTLSDNHIRSMKLAPDGTLWVGTFRGLNKFIKTQNKFQRFTEGDKNTASLSNSSIRSVFFDQRGGMWIGTYHGGVNYFHAVLNQFANFKLIPNQNSLSNNVVSSFSEDKKGNIWIGTEGGGLNFLDQKTKHFTNYQHQPTQANSLSGNNVKTLLKDNQQLWIGTFQSGLDLFDTSSGKFQNFKNDPTNPNSLLGNNVYGLLKEDNKLWILCHAYGLSILNLETKDFYNYVPNYDNETSLNSDLTRAILKDDNEQIWIGTEAGLYLVVGDHNKADDLRFQRFLKELSIYTIFEDSDKKLWLGTFGNGLVQFNPNDQNTIQYTTADGLSGNTVLGILEDEIGMLWISTNNGISRFNSNQKTFVNYNSSNGLSNHEYNYNAYYQTNEGQMLFGGIDGFSIFHPKNIQASSYIPPVAFTGLKQYNRLVSNDNNIFTKSLNHTDQLVFKHNEANFTLKFSVLDFINVSNNQYAYMLEGLDKDWNYKTGETEATYTIQRHGDYTFRLKGANSDGIWNDKERTMSVKVLPPPWLTGWAYLFYAIILGLLVYAVIRFVQLRHRLQLEQLAKQQQKELNEMKLKFFTNITHEFRTPLTLIVGPLEELIKKYGDKGLTKSLRGIRRNTNRLLNLVNQLLVFRKLENDYISIEASENDLIEFLNEIFLSFEYTAQGRNINYEFDHEEIELPLWFDPEKLEKVIFNLLSNAFKFTADAGHIKLSVESRPSKVLIHVSDNGKGIVKEQKEQIFKRFYEKTEGSYSMLKGLGIGLALSKQMIELHKGTLTVDSTIGKGTSFTVSLLKSFQHFHANEINSAKKIVNFNPPHLSTIPNQELKGKNQTISKKEKANLNQLLIVEDNWEMQEFIKNIFKDQYNIQLASNGKEGVKLALKIKPDLIISDVMMPEMDGNELCKKIKSNIEVSHIPIILLTAKNAIVNKLEGLRLGADDYVTKPFSTEELRLRVNNLIKSKEEIRTKFMRVVNIEAKEITVTSADEDFLNRAIAIAHEQLDNSDFSVLQFAHLLTVSRPLLFTKLKALTGQTPNNFIKTLRLKQAAQLLSQNKLNVAEVAYKVGFKDPKYFSKCFQKQFGQSPALYAREHNKESAS